jgi:hypothetical protein
VNNSGFPSGNRPRRSAEKSLFGALTGRFPAAPSTVSGRCKLRSLKCRGYLYISSNRWVSCRASAQPASTTSRGPSAALRGNRTQHAGAVQAIPSSDNGLPFAPSSSDPWAKGCRVRTISSSCGWSNIWQIGFNGVAARRSLLVSNRNSSADVLLKQFRIGIFPIARRCLSWYGELITTLVPELRS